MQPPAEPWQDVSGASGTDGFLEEPALKLAARELAAEIGGAARALPSAIGRYRIIRLLGEGGMGSVYEAEQEEPRRTVALKVIRSGPATPERLWRFRHESQALGRLQHPGIAQIYEASTAETPSGPQPYFAMELIRGLPLDQYAGAHGLNVRQRLLLMAKICEAVEHAHQRGLIHRDLKPGNILVDDAGQPKILDFGVARLAESEHEPTHQTSLGQLVGTLPYMSPEQVLGDPLEIDTRSDIYALGVILYQLLSGRLPYDVNRRPLHEAARVIHEEEPASLSSISRNCRGDIETIVGRALEKDKTRRYASAAALAADIQHYLNDEPIAARPPSATYQLRKFVRRHRALVAGTAAVFLVLVAGVAVSTWEAVRAQAEKRRAEEQSAAANAISDFLQNDLLRQASLVEQGTNKPDPNLSVRTALDRAAARIPGKFQKQPLVEAAVRQAIGTTYLNLDLLPEAQRQMERSLELRRQAVGENNPDTAISMNNLAVLYMNEGKPSQAEPLLAKALEVRRRVLGEEHPMTLVTMSNLGSLYRAEGKYPDAERAYLKAIEIRRRVLGANHRDTAMSMHNLAVLYRIEDKNSEGERLETQVLQIWRGVLGEENPITMRAADNLAAFYHADGKYAEAEALWSKVLEARRRLLGAQNPDTIDVMASLADAQLHQRKYAAAEPVARQALSSWEKTVPDSWKRYYGQALLGAVTSDALLLASGYQGLVQRQAAIPPESRALLREAEEWKLALAHIVPHPH